MDTRLKYITIVFTLLIVGAFGCKEQKDRALNYYKEKPQPNDSNIERFGFDEKATPKPTAKVVIPFDDKRTREEAKSL